MFFTIHSSLDMCVIAENASALQTHFPPGKSTLLHSSSSHRVVCQKVMESRQLVTNETTAFILESFPFPTLVF